MSTVIQPVGPREPRVYWLRRALVIGVPLVLILVIALSCSGGGKKKGTGKTHVKTKVTTSASAPTSPQTSSSPVLTACDPKTLTLTIKADAQSYTEGQSPKFTGTMKNPGTTGCTFSFAPTNEAWLVKSGPAQIWTTQGCAATTPAKAVTFKAGGHKRISVTWNGKVQLGKCAVGNTATNGTYTLAATLDGVAAKGIVVFHITS